MTFAERFCFDAEDLTFIPAGMFERAERALERYEELVALSEVRLLTDDEEEEQRRLRSGLDTLAAGASSLAKANRELFG